jgi:hypothetical protein
MGLEETNNINDDCHRGNSCSVMGMNQWRSNRVKDGQGENQAERSDSQSLDRVNNLINCTSPSFGRLFRDELRQLLKTS